MTAMCTCRFDRAPSDRRAAALRDVRKFGRVGLYRRRGGRHPATTRRAVRGARAGAARPGLHAARLSGSACAPARAAQAAAARPGVHRGRRQHLRRRGAVARTLHPLRLPAASARRRAAPLPGDPRVLAEAVDRRGSRWTTTPLPRATARCRSTSTSTSAPASHATAAGGRPADRARARGTHFCSWCQRLPSRRRAASATRLLRAGA